MKVNFYAVDCEMNDQIDIACGGATVLGFDFYTDIKDNIEDTKQYIKTMLNKYHLPLISITITTINMNMDRLWTREMMEKCIKTGY